MIANGHEAVNEMVQLLAPGKAVTAIDIHIGAEELVTVTITALVKEEELHAVANWCRRWKDDLTVEDKKLCMYCGEVRSEKDEIWMK